MSNRTQRNRQHEVDKAEQEKIQRMTKKLQYAVRNGLWELCEQALQHGADPNVLYNRDSEYFGTPLIMLIVQIRTPTIPSRIKKNIIRSLLKRGADIDATKDHVLTALNIAIILNRPKIFKFLIENGANINIRALRFAFDHNRVRMCKRLRERGAGGEFEASELQACSPEMKEALGTTSDLLNKNNLSTKGPYCQVEYQDSSTNFGYMGDIFGMVQLQYDWENGLNQVRTLLIVSDQDINVTGTLQVLQNAQARRKRARRKRARLLERKRARLLESDDTSDDDDDEDGAAAAAAGESKSDSLPVQIQSLRF